LLIVVCLTPKGHMACIFRRCTGSTIFGGKNEGGKIYRNGEGMGQLWATTFNCYCYWKIMEIKSARSVAPL